MQMYLKDCRGAESVLDDVDCLPLRLFESDRVFSDTPVENGGGWWRRCTRDVAERFSGIAFAFGRRLCRELNIPIGLVDTSWGGATCEAFTRMEVLASDPDLEPAIARRFDHPWFHAGVIWNGLMTPLVRFPVRGVIWYQGEGNVDRAWQYRKLLPAMIEDWRKQWKSPQLPFYIVQPTPYRAQGRDPRGLPELWEAQALTARSLPNTGIVVTTDVGDPDNAHPADKLPIADRLASVALADACGWDIPHEGPVFVELGEGNRPDALRVRFRHGGGGLVEHRTAAGSGSGLSGFQIAGSDGMFVAADARIEPPDQGEHADTVIVWSPSVNQPRHVRFAWTDTASPNLFNGAGFPAMPFRTDDLPLISWGKR